MDSSAWALLALFLVVLGLLAWPLGRWLAAMCEGRLPRWMQRAEAPLYKLAGVSPEQSMHWRSYALGLLGFQCHRRARRLRPAAPAGRAAAQPGRHGAPCRPTPPSTPR